MTEQETKKKNITKGSHFLPRVYLKNFLVDDKLFVYKKGEKFFLVAYQKINECLRLRAKKD